MILDRTTSMSRDSDLPRRVLAALPRVLAAFLMMAVLITGNGPLGAQTEDQPTFEAQRKPKKHRKKQPRPISLGTSGGNVKDRVVRGNTITCASGTLGLLIAKNNVQYILSNNHVMGLLNKAKVGDPINQPGLIDNRCAVEEPEFVGTFAALKRLKKKRNRVDMAIAKVNPGAVDRRGDIVKIGIPGNRPMDPFVGLRVKKSGRTTGLTKGTVIATGVSGNVDFAVGGLNDNTAKIKKFVNQTVVQGNTEAFSAGGDSGSGVWEDVSKCPRFVGLLFAGTGDITVINPSNEVMKALDKLKPKGKASLVGCAPAATAAAGGSGISTSTALDSSGSFSSAPIHSLEPDRQAVRAARQAQRRHEDELLAQRGIVGIGVGLAAEGSNEVVLKVFVEKADREILDRVPAALDGVPTEVMVTGRFKAF